MDIICIRAQKSQDIWLICILLPIAHKNMFILESTMQLSMLKLYKLIYVRLLLFAGFVHEMDNLTFRHSILLVEGIQVKPQSTYVVFTFFYFGLCLHTGFQYCTCYSDLNREESTSSYAFPLL